MSERHGSWMQTWYKGEKFYPLDPRPEDIHIEDIVHCLSRLCRYSGHSNKFYSVAEHSTMLSHIFPNHAKIALLHDAAEAFFGDLPRPIKQMLPDFKKYEHNLLAMVFEKFDVGPLDKKTLNIIENLDVYSLWLEKYSPNVMGNNAGQEWTCLDSFCRTKPANDIIKAWDPRTARINYQLAIEREFGIKVNIPY